MHLCVALIVILGDIVTLSQNRQVRNPSTNATQPIDVSQPSTVLQSSTSQQHTMPNCSKNICKGDEVCRAIGCPCPEGYVETAPAGTTGKTCLPVTTVGCPNGWDALVGDKRCYRVFNSRGIDRQEASDRCQWEQPGAELATVPAKAVAAYVIQKIIANTDEGSSETLDRKIWMGLMYDPARKSWTWPNGETPKTSDRRWKVAHNYKCTAIILTNNTKEIPFYDGLDCFTECDCVYTSADGFVCDMPRTLPGFEPPLRSFQVFEKICCDNATPILKEEKKDVVSHWILNSESESLSFDKSCHLHYGSLMIDLKVFHLIGNNYMITTIECDCPLAGLNEQCHEECDLLKFSYVRPSDKSRRRTGRRCACNAPFVGKQCEMVCKHGKREKKQRTHMCFSHVHSSCSSEQYECTCDDFYIGDDCSQFNVIALLVMLLFLSIPFCCLCCYCCGLCGSSKDTEIENNTDDYGLQQGNTISFIRIETIVNSCSTNNDALAHATARLSEKLPDSELPTYDEALVSNTGRKREDSNSDLPAYEDALKLCRVQSQIAGDSNKSNAANQ